MARFVLYLCVILASVASGQCGDRSPASYLSKRPADLHETRAYDWIERQLVEQRRAEPEEIRHFFAQISSGVAKGAELRTVMDKETKTKLLDDFV